MKSQFLCLLLAFLLTAAPSALSAPIDLTESDLAQYYPQPQQATRDFPDAGVDVDVDARASGGRAMNKEQWAHYKGAMLEKLNAHPNRKRHFDEDSFEERDFEDFDERDFEDFDERDLEALVDLVNARASGGRAMNKEQWANYKNAMLQKLDAHPNEHHKRDAEDADFEERAFEDFDERDLEDLVNLVNARASDGRAMNKEQWAHYKSAMLEKLDAHPNHRRDFDDAEDFQERDFEDLVDARASDGRVMNKEQWAHYKSAMLEKLNAHPYHRRDFDEDAFEERDFLDADVGERDLADDDVDERDFVDFEVEA